MLNMNYKRWAVALFLLMVCSCEADHQPRPARMPLEHLIQSLRKTNCNEHCRSTTHNRGILIGSIVTVGPIGGNNNFSSVQRAVEATPPRSEDNGYSVIYVRKGLYEEYVTIPGDRQYILLLGDGIDQTILTGNKYSKDGRDSLKSATFAAYGFGFVAVDITFRNTRGPQYSAVAARISSNDSAFYRCSFEGHQDTLLADTGMQFFRECNVYGTVDFIYGDAAVVFQACHIYSRKPLHGQETTVTAQARKSKYDHGVTAFQNCTFEPAVDLAEDTSFSKNYLGRPWHPYSRVVIMQSYLDKHIDPKGWIPYRGNLGLNTLYYGEYDNYGPGSNTAGRVNWKGYHVIDTREEAARFTVYYLDMSVWLSKLDIPFTRRL